MHSITLNTPDDVSALVKALGVPGCFAHINPDGTWTVSVPDLSASAADAIALNLSTARKPQLIAYANAKQATIQGGGVSVILTGITGSVECATSPEGLVLLQGAATIAAANNAATFNWVPSTGSPLTLTAAQITQMFGLVSAFLQSTFTTLAAVITAVNAGTITTTAAVDSFASPAWPVNS